MIAPIEQNRVGQYYDDGVAARPRTTSNNDQSLHVVRETIGNHPVAAVAVAAVVGVAAAWVIKRGIRS